MNRQPFAFKHKPKHIEVILAKDVTPSGIIYKGVIVCNPPPCALWDVAPGQEEEGEEVGEKVKEGSGARLSTLLDQKNYVEELNRSLTANVINLQVCEC